MPRFTEPELSSRQEALSKLCVSETAIAPISMDVKPSAGKAWGLGTTNLGRGVMHYVA